MSTQSVVSSQVVKIAPASVLTFFILLPVSLPAQTLSTSYSPSAVATTNVEEDVFILDTSGNTWSSSLAPTGNTWSGWYPLGGTVAGTPSVTINGGVEEIYGLSPYDGNIYHNFLAPGAGWSGWYSLGGYNLGLISAPSTIVNTNVNMRDLFVIDHSGNTWHQYLANGSSWSGWISMGGSIAANPAAT